MGNTQIEFLWRRPAVLGGHRTGVSLHSHTLHSRESLEFVPRVCASIPGLHFAVERASRTHGVKWRRAWWTPPLGAHQAWELEAQQIAEGLQLAPLVSLSDHDTIEAPTQLRVLEEFREVPLSVEWTIPWKQTFFHLGVHNLPASTLWEGMKGAPEERLADLLAALHELPDVLTVFNHPFWDEKGIGQALHDAAVANFLERCGAFVHAVELNGLRPLAENRRALAMAQGIGKPAVSGGDRHGREPNACLNLTQASCFAEFVGEVREGESQILFLPQYRENRALRVTHQIWEVLREDATHGLGWRFWNDRIFYECRDGQIRSLRELWGEDAPLLVRCFIGAIDLVSQAPLRRALRAAFPPSEEMV